MQHVETRCCQFQVGHSLLYTPTTWPVVGWTCSTSLSPLIQNTQRPAQHRQISHRRRHMRPQIRKVKSPALKRSTVCVYKKGIQIDELQWTISKLQKALLCYVFASLVAMYSYKRPFYLISWYVYIQVTLWHQSSCDVKIRSAVHFCLTTRVKYIAVIGNKVNTTNLWMLLHSLF